MINTYLAPPFSVASCTWSSVSNSPHALYSSWCRICIWSTWLPYQWCFWGWTSAMPRIQVQEIYIYWDHKLGPYSGQGVYGAPVIELQWWYISPDCQELQPFLQRYLLQANREINSKVGKSTGKNRYHFLTKLFSWMNWTLFHCISISTKKWKKCSSEYYIHDLVGWLDHC